MNLLDKAGILTGFPWTSPGAHRRRVVPKQTNKQMRAKEIQRAYFRRGLIKLTKAYQQFHDSLLAVNPEDRKSDPHLALIKQAIEQRKERGPYPDDQSFEDTIEGIIEDEFLQTDEGWRIMRELGACFSFNRSVKVIPELPPRVGTDQRAQIEEGRYLTCRLDLMESKEQIRAKFDSILNYYHTLVTRPDAVRGDTILEMEKSDEMIKAYKCVEKYGGSISDAARELYPDISKASIDGKTRIEQLRRWHANIKSILQDL